MIYVYAALSAVLLCAAAAGRRYKKEFFAQLDKKEHPLRFMYGSALFLYELGTALFPLAVNKKAERMIRSLSVKENAKKETVLYGVKKIALGLCIILAASLAGFCFCAAGRGKEAVTTLRRNEYGSGSASYELEVEYKDESSVVEIEIEERQYTDEEIYELFEEAYEAVKTEMLGENESEEYVTEPLDLVSSYGEIDIYWESEDPQSLDYNGEITAQPEEGESVTINLYATFALEDVSCVYVYPVTLVGEGLSETELLIASITEAIEEGSSVYESEVALPEEIDGEEISFSEVKDNTEAVFLVVGVIAVIALILLYDRKLEDGMKARNEQMLLDFTEIVTKLSLLYEAGLSICSAWERIISDYEGREKKEEHFAYSEMKLALEKIRSGVSESRAYEEFGSRCALHPYIKLGNVLSQNLSKGSRGMKILLNQEAQAAFEERKRLARKKGEEAGTKMLFPMILLLVIVIVIVAVPALMSISF